MPASCLVSFEIKDLRLSYVAAIAVLAGPTDALMNGVLVNLHILQICELSPLVDWMKIECPILPSSPRKRSLFNATTTS